MPVNVCEKTSRLLEPLNAKQKVESIFNEFGDEVVVTTSFGIQSAAFLHLVNSVNPEVKIIWIDTGYCFPETYKFADSLIELLNLNVVIGQAEISPARMEAKYGKLWEGNVEDIKLYNQLRKVEPLTKLLEDLNVNAWMSGLRSHQTTHRSNLNFAMIDESEKYRFYPLLDWNNRDVHSYLKYYNLPYHPLFEKNYMSVGDWHSSRPVSIDDYTERDSRFGGKVEECGLHL